MRFNKIIFDFDHTLVDFGAHVEWRRAIQDIEQIYLDEGIPKIIVEQSKGVGFKLMRSVHDYMLGSLSLPDPWESVVERYPANSRAYGRVMNVTDYGAFVELEPGVEGLIHVSEMTWSKRTKHPSKIVKSGDQVEVVVLEVHPKRSEERRVGKECRL